MSFFKEMLKQDIQNVFLDLDEFGEEIEIDGETRVAVIDDSQGVFQSGSRNDFSNVSGIGLVENSRTIYLEDNFEERPVPGQLLEINGEKWIVKDDPGSVKVEMGMLVLRISRDWS